MKAIFSDFYGTIVREESPTSYEAANRIFNSSKADTLEEVVSHWWGDYRSRIALACGDAWRPQNDVALDTLEQVLSFFDSSEDPVELRDIMNDHWSYPPIFEDSKRFLAGLQLPLYFVTNSDDLYITEALKFHQIACTGVFTSEQAKYSKPQPQIFEYALDTLGLEPHEVIHIGDSLQSDVACPASLGIKTIWLNRKNMPVPEGVVAASSLDEALEILARLLTAP